MASTDTHATGDHQDDDRHSSLLSRRTMVGGGALLGAGLISSALIGGKSAAQQSEDGTPTVTPNTRQAPATPAPLGDALPPELNGASTDWPTAQGNLSATRAATDSTIDSGSVGQLGVAWRYPLTAVGQWGGMTANPIVIGDRVYLQDASCSIFALDKATGEELWRTDFNEKIGGPNGLGIGYGMIVASLGDAGDVVGLNLETGELVWRVKLTNNHGETIELAPVVYDSAVYVSTNPTGSGFGQYRGGQKGILYALDVSTGETLWQFDTTTDNLWGNAHVNSGGGVWYPVAIDDAGNLYFGTGNAGPWPGTPEFPNGSSRTETDLYASSMVSLEPETGAVRWAVQAKPHDLFDLDFQNTPVLTTVSISGADTPLAIGSGKTGTVIAANADSGTVLWQVSVGTHENDTVDAVPDTATEDNPMRVFPGSLGGVETPIAVANGVVFVPVVNNPAYYTPTKSVSSGGGLNDATGNVVALDAATGAVLWDVELPTGEFCGVTVANDIVFAGGLDGLIRGFSAKDGSLIWSFQTGAGLNAPFAVSGDMLLVPAAGPMIASSDTQSPAPAAATEVIAFKLGATEAATPTA
jgi:glucose dehydrogenase